MSSRPVIRYHFLKADMTAGHGKEPPWEKGEKRTATGDLELCANGYHYGLTLLGALEYAPGPVFCRVRISGDRIEEGDKGCARTRELVAWKNAEKELRLFAADCAERALLRERKDGSEPDPRSWAAVAVARRYSNGEATQKELARSSLAASNAASSAASNAASYASSAASNAASAASYAASAVERKWQERRLRHYLKGVK